MDNILKLENEVKILTKKLKYFEDLRSVESLIESKYDASITAIKLRLINIPLEIKDLKKLSSWNDEEMINSWRD